MVEVERFQGSNGDASVVLASLQNTNNKICEIYQSIYQLKTMKRAILTIHVELGPPQHRSNDFNALSMCKRGRTTLKRIYLRPHVLVYMGGVKRFQGSEVEALVVPEALANLQSTDNKTGEI